MEAAVLKSESPALIARFDQLADELARLEAEQARVDGEVDAKRKEIQKLVEKHGIMPDGATKSLRLEGSTHQATLSYPTRTSIDQDKVEKLRDLLKKLGEKTLFRRLFIVNTKYVLSPRFNELVAKLPKPVKSLAQKVVTSDPQEPRLSVEPKKQAKRSKKADA